MSRLREQYRILAVVFAIVVLGVAPARASVQTSGSQQFPGKVMIGIHPAGVQVNDDGTAWYKLAFDIAGLLGHPSNLGVWLGGGTNYALHNAGPTHDVQVWMFVLLSFERFIRIPLVPTLRLGLGTDVFFVNGNYASGSLALKLGPGLHYWLTKNVGLGVETGVAFGPVFVDHGPNKPTTLTGYASWDLTFGARFAF